MLDRDVDKESYITCVILQLDFHYYMGIHMAPAAVGGRWCVYGKHEVYWDKMDHTEHGNFLFVFNCMFYQLFRVPHRSSSTVLG